MTAPESSYLQAMQASSPLFGGNNVFIEGLYEDYLRDPGSVPPEWREYFAKLQSTGSQADVAHSPIRQGLLLEAATSSRPAVAQTDEMRKQASVLQLINAHRFLGVRAADLDPLARHVKPEVAELNPSYYNLSESDMNTLFNTGSLVGGARMTLRDILQRLRRIYCGSVGAEYMYINNVAQKRWIQSRLEGEQGLPNYPAETRRAILSHLTAAEGLERYLHTKYVWQKRFSLEGGETLIPLLHHLLQRAG